MKKTILALMAFLPILDSCGSACPAAITDR